MVLEADLVLCMRAMEVYLHCPCYFDFERSVDGPVYQSCPSSPSSTSCHLLPFLLTMEQTKKASLETGVSSHLVLHNKSVGKCSRQSQCQWVVSMTREWWAQIDMQTPRQLACHFWSEFGWKSSPQQVSKWRPVWESCWTLVWRLSENLSKNIMTRFLAFSFPFCIFCVFPCRWCRQRHSDDSLMTLIVMYFNNSLTIWNTEMNAIDKEKNL